MDSYIDKWVSKEKKNVPNQNVNIDLLRNWKETVLKMVDNRIEKGKTIYRRTWSVNIDGKVKTELDRLKRNMLSQ